MPGMRGTMHEFKHHELHSRSKHGPIVKSRAQAIAIGLSEERKEGHRVSKHAPHAEVANHHRHAEHHAKHHHSGHPHSDPPKHHVDHSHGHSHLRSQDNGSTHKQPKGKPTGEHKDVAKGHDGEHGVFSYEAHPGRNKAHHHPVVEHRSDSFSRVHTGESHGFGHPADRRHGHLRMSGHGHSHRIGHR